MGATDHLSAERQQYVMLGVTGPNEYENNVNNNWYTSTIAIWCLKYTIEAIGKVKQANQAKYNDLATKITFREEQECEKFADIISKMYFAHDDKLGIFLQQDGYLDKEQILVKDLPAADRPLVQKWSWGQDPAFGIHQAGRRIAGLYFLRIITISIPFAGTTTFMSRGQCMSRRYRPAYTPY